MSHFPSFIGPYIYGPLLCLYFTLPKGKHEQNPGVVSIQIELQSQESADFSPESLGLATFSSDSLELALASSFREHRQLSYYQMQRFLHTVQQQHTTVPSTGNTLNYRVTYHTEQKIILNHAIEVLAPISIIYNFPTLTLGLQSAMINSPGRGIFQADFSTSGPVLPSH